MPRRERGGASNYSMLKLSFLVALATAWFAAAPAAFGQADLTLNVTVITSEHSRDSNSTTRTLGVAGLTLSYAETYHGARSDRHQPISKEFTLTEADRDRLMTLLKEHSLLRTKSISKPLERDGPSRDFEIKIAAKVGRQNGLISIKGPRNAEDLKSDPLYQGSVLLIAELFKIIKRTDPDITLGELIR